MDQSLAEVYTIILAAGEGKRAGLTDINKVTLNVAGTPILSQTLKKLSSLGIKNIIVVIGHAKESVLKLLDQSIKVVEQAERLGTADALKVGLTAVPDSIKDVLVLYGDDSFNLDLNYLKQLYQTHTKNNNQMTFLTADLENPTGIGRIIRDNSGNIIDLVEEKDATDEQRKIKEVNIACYLFSLDFLKKYLPKIEKSSITNEYYLTQIIKIAIENNEKVEAIKINHPNWQGINTMDDLVKAEKLANI